MVNINNVEVMKIVDSYAMKGIGGILSYKFVKTYLKLLSSKGLGKPQELIEATFDIPAADVRFGNILPGKNILVERLGNKLKYLGAEGDWEVMLNYGVDPNQKAIFEQKYRQFNEEVPDDILKINVDGNLLTITSLNECLGRALVDSTNNTLTVEFAKDKTTWDLFSKYSEPRGLKIKKLRYVSD